MPQELLEIRPVDRKDATQAEKRLEQWLTSGTTSELDVKLFLFDCRIQREQINLQLSLRGGR